MLIHKGSRYLGEYCDDNNEELLSNLIDTNCDGWFCEDGTESPHNDVDCDGISSEIDCNDFLRNDDDCDGILTEEDCDDIREAVLVQLEYAIDILSFTRHAPSLIGIAAFLNAVEDYSDDEGYDESILDCIQEVFGLSLEKTKLRQVRFMMAFQVDEAEYIGLIET